MLTRHDAERAARAAWNYPPMSDHLWYRDGAIETAWDAAWEYENHPDLLKGG